MAWLVLGLMLWTGAHFFKRVLPVQRAAMGKAGRGLVALLIVAGIVLMVVGYRATDYVHLYDLPAGVWWLNNVLMLVALFLLDVAKAGVVRQHIRHPMLTAVVVWMAAHLLINGDLAALILFGGLGLWALAEMVVLNHAEGPWEAPPPGTIARDVRTAAIAVVLYALIVGAHYWFGFTVLAVMR